MRVKPSKYVTMPTLKTIWDRNNLEEAYFPTIKVALIDLL